MRAVKMLGSALSEVCVWGGVLTPPRRSQGICGFGRDSILCPSGAISGNKGAALKELWTIRTLSMLGNPRSPFFPLMISLGTENGSENKSLKLKQKVTNPGEAASTFIRTRGKLAVQRRGPRHWILSVKNE